STPDASVQFNSDSGVVGQPVLVNLRLPPGNQCLCIVANGVYPVNSSFGGTPVYCRAQAGTGAAQQIQLWTPAPPGQFDVLAPGGSCRAGAGLALAADARGPARGLPVTGQALVPAPAAVLLLLAVLASVPLSRRIARRPRRSR